MDTLLLDRTTWDFVVDANGNIAVASNPYALAQDAASAIRLVRGELFYDTSKGIPFFDRILGKLPPPSLMKASFVNAALTVPEVTAAVCVLSTIDPNTRQVTGQVQVKGANVSVAAPFVAKPPPAVETPTELPDVSVLNASVS